MKPAPRLPLRALPCLALLAAACAETPGPRPGNWKLTWSDEFDGPAGQRPDPAKWGADVGGSGWGNQQLEYDTDLPSNSALDGQGNLAIVARKEPFAGNQYTSARLTTKNRFTQAYGRFEARIKMPTGRGVWPAFWMLGSDVDVNAWPACGEIDIMEGRGQEPLINNGSLHGPGHSADKAITASYALPGPAGFPDDFHVFAVEWDTDQIVFKVDEETYSIVPASRVTGNLRWVYDHPFYIILNVAVGGLFVGDPSPATVFPQTMLVDYVRVYRRE